MPSLSVICPTRNRAPLWRSAWLLDSLRAQAEPPDELVIALDHTEDDTLDTILDQLQTHPLNFSVRIIEVLAPRPEPHPASGFPDNCLFHAATGDILFHVDDDIYLPRQTLELTRALFEDLPNIALWYPMTFVDENHAPLPDGQDWRFRMINQHWPRVPAGLTRPPPNSQAFTGAIWSTSRAALHAIGGHDLATCGYHNQDTRIGNRLLKYCDGGSYLCTSRRLTAEHLGLTWHMQHRSDHNALRAAYGAPRSGPTIANGGNRFWTSPWFNSAYRTLTTTGHRLQSDSVRP
jgi:glycosyltransferase involved in cell wall biosynthesis